MIKKVKHTASWPEAALTTGLKLVTSYVGRAHWALPSPDMGTQSPDPTNPGHSCAQGSAVPSRVLRL